MSFYFSQILSEICNTMISRACRAVFGQMGCGGSGYTSGWDFILRPASRLHLSIQFGWLVSVDWHCILPSTCRITLEAQSVEIQTVTLFHFEFRPLGTANLIILTHRMPKIRPPSGRVHLQTRTHQDTAIQLYNYVSSHGYEQKGDCLLGLSALFCTLSLLFSLPSPKSSRLPL